MSELFVLVAFAWVLTSVFTAAHAKDNGKTGLWGVVVLIFGIFGLVVYAISLASE